MQIAGKTAVVSGASSGIGAASAQALANQGAHVILLARRQEALEALATEIQAKGGQASVYAVDLSDPTATEEVTQAILQEHGPPDILFNNAGLGRWLYVEETSIAEATQMMAVPYLAAFQLTRAFLPAMKARGSGHILNITSPAGVMAWEGATAYTAARFAMRGFSQALAAELADSGLAVTLLMPGKVSSEYFASNPGSEARLPGISKWYRELSPEEVAQALIVAIEKEQREVILPALMKWTLRLHQLLPRTVEWTVRQSGSAERAGQSKRFQLGIGLTGLAGLGMLSAILLRGRQRKP